MNLDPNNPQPGIYHNCPEEIYRKAPGINQSSLKDLDVSAAYYFAQRLKKDEPTEAQKMGTLIHGMILQNRKLFAVIPKDAPKKPTATQLNARKPSDETIAAISWWKKFEIDNPGKEFIDAETAREINDMHMAVISHPQASEILNRATPKDIEVAGFSIHEETGLLMKGLADVLIVSDDNTLVIPDLKTCQLGDGSPENFGRQIFKWGYHRQAAFYLDLFNAKNFIFISLEKEPPYHVCCFNLDRESILLGREQNQLAMRKLKWCLTNNQWPGYPDGIIPIGVPDWAKK